MEVLSNRQFKEQLINNNDTNIDEFLSFMDEVKNYQSYLTQENFAIYNDYKKTCDDLVKLDSSILNPTQQKVVKHHAKSMANISFPSFSLNSDNDEGGTTRKYTNPNGFISILLIILSTISTGVFIAWMFISKL